MKRYKTTINRLDRILGSPLAKEPPPTHAAKMHTAWKKWCPLCVDLKAYVDRITGLRTPWTAMEQL